MHKGLLNRESLRAEDGVKYFRDTLRPHFIKKAQNVFLWRFYIIIRARTASIDMVDWTGKFSLLLKRLTDAWMDMSPLSVMSSERRESQCMVGMTQLNAERSDRQLRRPCTFMNKRPEAIGTQRM